MSIIDYNKIKNAQAKLKKFKIKYFQTVAKAQKIMPAEKTDRKPSHFWKVGKLLYCFTKSIKNNFEIINYNSTVARDFELYEATHTGAIIKFGELFNKQDIDDTIPMSVYLELIWKSDFLNNCGILDKEKKRLLKLAKGKNLPSHKAYRKKLNEIIAENKSLCKNHSG